MSYTDFEYTFQEPEMHDALGLAAGQQPAAGGQFLFTEMGTTTVHLALPVPGYQAINDMAAAARMADKTVHRGLALEALHQSDPLQSLVVAASEDDFDIDPNLLGFQSVGNALPVRPGGARGAVAAFAAAHGDGEGTYTSGAVSGDTTTIKSQEALKASAKEARSSRRDHSGGSGMQKVESRSQINHSAVEKQRRDRINSLIDELRELVPPQTGSPGDTDAQKRAKHVVLADTIALLKSLQPQLRALNGSASPSLPPLARAPSAAAANANAGLPASGWPQAVAAAADGFKAEGQQAGCGFAEDSEAQQRGSCCSSDSHEQLLLARMAQQQQAAGAAWPPPLPSVPAAIDSEYRVAVEPRPDGAMFVRVKCRDRRGLLCDISNSLKQLPLEVTTAAITTTPDGRVHDVFEIRPMKGVNVSMAEVHACVEMALLEMATMGSVHGTKRLRGALG